MIAPPDLTWIEFLQRVHIYIDNIGQGGRLWPIVAFVYLGDELRYLIFPREFEAKYKQEGDPRNTKLHLAMNRRRWISIILLAALLGVSFFNLLLTKRSPARGTSVRWIDC